MKGKLLIVDDNTGILSALKLLLGKYFDSVITLNSPLQLISTLQNNKVDIVLLDMNFTTNLNTGNEGLYWLREIKQFDATIEVVLFTAYAEIELAVKGMKEGAADFLVKPWENEKMVEVLKHTYQKRKRNEGKNNTIKTVQRNNEIKMFWGETPEMEHLLYTTKRVAQTDADILITGENGTGKEMLAREIHRLSTRNEVPLVVVDVGAISETLFESELFGHTKGAFTDAINDRRGKFEEADGGTLFLDEIGNLPLHLQAKLLTAIQSRTIVRIGENTPIHVDTRIIYATNRNLKEMVVRGEFREDLYYRIHTIQLEIPPLRERKADIIPLAKEFVKLFARKHKLEEIPVINDRVATLLSEQRWEGNVRELMHTIERAVILSNRVELKTENFSFPTVKQQPKEELTFDYMEKQAIIRAIEQCNGNLTQVASLLCISRQTLYNRLKKHNL